MRSAKPQRPRIIGGRWRGRQLGEITSGARPTPDRVRETAFNWLAPEISGRHCLDLFAGSGALGLEALSRGATHSLLIDADPEASRRISTAIAELGAARQAKVLCRDACSWLQQPPANIHFDLAFLDPPYASGLLAPCCAALERKRLLRDGALIYTECGEAGPLEIPSNWHRLHTQRAGRVYYSLYQSVDIRPPAPLKGA